MNRGKLLRVSCIGGALTLVCLMLSQSPAQRAEVARTQERPSAGQPTQLRAGGAPTHLATSNAKLAASCPECKPGTPQLAPVVAPERAVGPRPAGATSANKAQRLNARLARHLEASASRPLSAAEQRAREAQLANYARRAEAARGALQPPRDPSCNRPLLSA